MMHYSLVYILVIIAKTFECIEIYGNFKYCSYDQMIAPIDIHADCYNGQRNLKTGKQTVSKYI
jgi:hypothetical protein